MTSFYIISLGCKVNQCEAEAVAQAWEALGMRRASDPGEADVALVSLCAVTAHAVRDGRQAVRKLGREHPRLKLVVTGCAAEVMPEEFRNLDGVVRVVGQKSKSALAGGPEGDAADAPDWLPLRSYHRARAVLRVQDGCSHCCAYCIVPRARGASRSRPAREVLEEARVLLDAGFRELVVSGINLRHWGRETGEDFWDLMAGLERELAGEWAGRARFRLSSLEPGQLDGRALEYLSMSRLVCPQLHLSLQSGSVRILERMRREHYRPEDVLRFCRELSAAWPVYGLGADLLVAFPGETETEFRETLDMARELPLTYAHVFPYSPRPGTVAAGMDGRVPSAEAKARARELRELAEGKKKGFLARCSGLPEVRVLVQDASGLGVTEHYVGCRLDMEHASAPVREIAAARPAGIRGGRLLAEAKA